MVINDIGLVLEGGGMRGIFTIGVLDALMDAGIHFPYVIGVSAGACNGCSYVTKQRGRARFSNISMLKQYGTEYLGVKMLIKTGNIFNAKLLYDYLPNRIWPFDYKRFFNTTTEFEMVTTNLVTGRPEYLSNHLEDFSKLAEVEAQKLSMDIVLASSSLPYVSKNVYVRGVPMLDGGIVDSIPVERAMSKGYSKNLVVLTRNKGYRKEVKGNSLSAKFLSVVDYLMYRKYPLFRKALRGRSELYNSQLENIEKLELEGSVIVIRPEKPIEVDRIERDPERLQRLYDEGYMLGKRTIETKFKDICFKMETK